MAEKTIIFDFENKEHFLFLNYLISLHRDKFLNDFVCASDFITWLYNGQKNGEPLFICYLDNGPYGIIYANIEYPGIATIHASTRNNTNFFTNIRILNNFIQYLFSQRNMFKVKAELLVFDNTAEFLLRCAGLKKEGILKDEIYLGGKPYNMLLLAMTKKEFLNRKKLTRKEIIKIGKIIKHE